MTKRKASDSEWEEKEMEMKVQDEDLIGDLDLDQPLASSSSAAAASASGHHSPMSTLSSSIGAGLLDDRGLMDYLLWQQLERAQCSHPHSTSTSTCPCERCSAARSASGEYGRDEATGKLVKRSAPADFIAVTATVQLLQAQRSMMEMERKMMEMQERLQQLEGVGKTSTAASSASSPPAASSSTAPSSLSAATAARLAKKRKLTESAGSAAAAASPLPSTSASYVAANNHSMRCRSPAASKSNTSAAAAASSSSHSSSSRFSLSCIPPGPLSLVIALVYRFLPLRDVATASRANHIFHAASANPLIWQDEDLRREKILMLTGGWRGPVKFAPSISPFHTRSGGGLDDLKLEGCTMPYMGRGRASKNDAKSGQQLLSSTIFKNVTNVRLYWTDHPDQTGNSRKLWQAALKETEKQRSNRHKRKFIPVLNQLSAFPHATALHTHLHQLLNMPDRDLTPDIDLLDKIGQSNFWRRLRVLRIRLPGLTSGSRLPLQKFLDILARTQLQELSIGSSDEAPLKPLPADKKYVDAVTAASDAAASAAAATLQEQLADEPPLQGMELAYRRSALSAGVAAARTKASNATLATQLDFTPLAQLSTLRHLCISFGQSESTEPLPMAIARALPNFTHLHTLTLVHMKLDDVESMCQPDALAGLQKLDVGVSLEPRHEAMGLRRLACLANLRHVRTLIIRNENLCPNMGRWPLLPLMAAREKDGSAFHALRSYTYQRANHYCFDSMRRIPIPIAPFPTPLAALPPLDDVSLTLCSDGLFHSPETLRQFCTQLQHVRSLTLIIHVSTGPPSKGFDWCRYVGWSHLKELTHLRIEMQRRDYRKLMPHHLREIHSLIVMPKLQHVNVVGLVQLDRKELEQLLTLRPMSSAARPADKTIADPTRYRDGRSDEDYAVMVRQTESYRARMQGAAGANLNPDPHDLLNDPPPPPDPPSASEGSSLAGGVMWVDEEEDEDENWDDEEDDGSEMDADTAFQMITGFMGQMPWG